MSVYWRYRYKDMGVAVFVRFLFATVILRATIVLNFFCVIGPFCQSGEISQNVVFSCIN